MTTMTDERRTLDAEIRELETTESLSMLRGLAVPYDTPADIGWFTEEFAPSSMSKSINRAADRRLRNGNGLPLLLFHDAEAMPIGVSTEWEETARGLVGTWRLSNDRRSQDAAAMVRDGMLNNMSIRFAPVRSTWTYADDFAPDLGPAYKDKVRREEARLLETSLVTTPAYESASVEWIRSAEPMRHRKNQRTAVSAWRQELDKLRSAR